MAEPGYGTVELDDDTTTEDPPTAYSLLSLDEA